jgi:hypothetical protein
MSAEAINLLKAQRKIAETYMSEQAGICADAQQTHDAAQKEADRMQTRIEAIDLAIEQLS